MHCLTNKNLLDGHVDVKLYTYMPVAMFNDHLNLMCVKLEKTYGYVDVC